METQDQRMARIKAEVAAERAVDEKDRQGKMLPLIPLVGEIGCSKKGEFKQAWQLIQGKGIDQLHVYVDVDNPGWIDNHMLDPSILAEIKAIV